VSLRTRAPTEADGSVVIHAARGRYALLPIASLAFTAAGVSLLQRGDPAARWIAIACILFFGAGTLVLARQLLDRRPRLVFDDIGVTDRTLGVGRIPWEAIEDAQLASIRNNAFVCLTLRDEAHWVAKLPPLQRRLAGANRALGFSSLNLNLAGLAVEPATVLALVHGEILRRRGPMAGPYDTGGDPG